MIEVYPITAKILEAAGRRVDVSTPIQSGWRLASGRIGCYAHLHITRKIPETEETSGRHCKAWPSTHLQPGTLSGLPDLVNLVENTPIRRVDGRPECAERRSGRDPADGHVHLARSPDSAASPPPREPT